MLHERFPIAVKFLCEAMNHTWGSEDCFEIETLGIEQDPGAIGFHSSFMENDFNGSAITFDLHSPGDVVLEVYDASGRKVETLVDNSMNTGLHSVAFEGSGVSAGVYFYTIHTQGEMVSGKILVLH